MKNILLCGDSWACGEWDFIISENTYGVSDYTWDNYFYYKPNINFKTCGKANCSNYDSYLQLKSAIKDFSPDVILWMQTDPIRDLRPYDNIYNLFSSYEIFIKKQNELLDNTYSLFDSFNAKIYCLGGTSKLNLHLLSKYKNLVPFIESIKEFLYPNLIHQEICISDWREKIFSMNLEKDMLDILYENFTIQRLTQKKEFAYYFSPDGGHPNRTAINVVCNYIYNNICVTDQSSLIDI
jgi:hypothetical protein